MIRKTQSTPQKPSTSPRRAGDFDPSFGVNGMTTINEPNSLTDMYIGSVTPDPAVETHQKIYVTCENRSGTQLWLVCLLENGLIDENYGNAGYVLISDSSELGKPYFQGVTDIIFLPSGSIIIFGLVLFNVGGDQIRFPVATCVTVDGAIDTSFGNFGIMTYFLPLPTKKTGDQKNVSEKDFKPALSRSKNKSPEGNFSSAPNVISAQESNLLVVKSIADGDYNHIASYILKIRPDGALDKNFGTEGLVLIEDDTTSPARLPDCGHYYIDRRGGVVVVGRNGRVGAGTTEGVVIKYDALGATDPAFNGSGVLPVSNPYGYSTQLRGVKALDDGKIIVLAAFFSAPFAYQNPAVLKLTLTGELDSDFNQGAPAIIDLDPFGFLTQGMTIDDGDRIIVCGQITGIDVPSGACASRLLPDGKLDAEYGTNGTIMHEGLSEFAHGQIHSKVKVVGSLRDASEGTAYVVRLLG